MNIRYLLCNADEMEPGTYKDRLLMEQLPHLLVEGMLISAFCAESLPWLHLPAWRIY
ncbi:NADH dehydrogenase I subunit F [Escherichia coli]|nr:NADH dehydrogenase I subunit F [Escherichia coli]